MNWDAAGAIGEIIGAAGVVLTLFYLARQIKDNNTQVRVNSLTALNNLYNDCFLPIYNSRDNMNLWVKGLSAPESLPEVEREIFFLFLLRLVAPFETIIAQYHHGILEEDEFQRYRSTILRIVHSDGGKAWLRSRPVEFSPEAERYLDLDEIHGRGAVRDPT